MVDGVKIQQSGVRVISVYPGNRETLRVSGPGFLEVYRSAVGDLPVLHVEGSPEEMGRQYGTLAGDMIRRNVNRMIGLFTAMGLPETVAHLVLDKTWERLARHTLGRYLREMAAIAEGAQDAGFDVGVADIQRLTAVTNFDLYRREERIMEMFGADIAAHFAANGAPPGPACTMFSMWGSRTVDGKLFASRNLDWVSQTGMHEDRLVTVYKPEGFNAFVTMDYAGVVGALAGMNEKGIAFSEIGAFSTREEFDGTPWILIARRVLEEAGSLEEGVRLVEQAQHTIGLNYMVADGDPSHFGTADFRPRAAVFETNFECCETFHEDDSKEHQACWTDSNGDPVPYGLPLKEAVMRADTAFGARTRALQAADNGPGNPENDGDPRKGPTYVECHVPMHDLIRAYETGQSYVYPLRGTVVLEEGAPRAIGPQEAMTIAATVAHNTEKLEESDWNVMSVIYAPTDLDFWVAYETCHPDGHWTNAPDSGYLAFNLGALLRANSPANEACP